MKKLNKILMIFIMSVALLPFAVKAADASIDRWALQCDKVDDIVTNEVVHCHLLALVNDATSGDKDITYIITRIDGDGIEVTDVTSPTGLMVSHTDFDDPFTTLNPPIPRQSGAKCTASFGCYDWYSNTGKIVNDTSSTFPAPSYQNYNDVAAWSVKIDFDNIRDDVDCAKICVYADYFRDGDSEVIVAQTGSNPSPCIELHYRNSLNPTCKYDGTNYYNKTGAIVTKEEYLEECACRIEGGKYYDDNNEEVTEEQYNKVCNPKCYCDTNGQCYDDNGEPVTPEEYEKSCGCRIDNGKYYDNEGKETTEENYYKVCNPKCYCNQEGQCYDGKGKPVTKEQYDAACGCRKENGKFYDDKGQEVDEKTWNEKCIPPTGTFAPYVSLGVLLIIGYGMFNLIKYYKNNKKIYRV